MYSQANEASETTMSKEIKTHKYRRICVMAGLAAPIHNSRNIAKAKAQRYKHICMYAYGNTKHEQEYKQIANDMNAAHEA